MHSPTTNSPCSRPNSSADVFHVNPTVDVVTIIAISIPLALVVIASLVDVARRRGLSVWRKTLWALLIVFTAYVGAAIYAIARPVRRPEGKRYGESIPRASGIVDDLEELRNRRELDDIDPIAYLEAKRTLLGLDVATT